jgi:predicted nucleic acid-binding protein
MTRPLRTWTGVPVVIDSSVAFKWFDQTEPGADVALELLASHRREEVAIVVPEHLPLEVVNALKCRGAALEDLERAIHALADVELLLAPLDEALLVSAVKIAAEDSLALYDAVFVALAKSIEASLVTADRRQASTRHCPVRLIG